MSLVVGGSGMCRLSLPVILTITLLASTPEAGGAVAVLTPEKDNTLYQNEFGALSNGSGIYIFAGRTAQLDIVSRRRALLSFDIAGNIPAGAIVSEVSLTMQMSRTPGASALVWLHRALADWGEGASDAFGQEGAGGVAETGDATWIHTFHDTDLWASAGGDFTAEPSAIQVVVGIGSYTWTDPSMVADVQSWLDDPESNFGWCVIGSEDSLATVKRFGSREFPDPSSRPTLTVTFSGPRDVVPTSSEWGVWFMVLSMIIAGAGILHQRRMSSDVGRSR